MILKGIFSIYKENKDGIKRYNINYQGILSYIHL